MKTFDMKNLKDVRKQNKELANGKSSKDCTFEEKVEVYKRSVNADETSEERRTRINAFRCGW